MLFFIVIGIKRKKNIYYKFKVIMIKCKFLKVKNNFSKKGKLVRILCRDSN